MKIARVGTGYIVFIWGLVFFLLASVLFYGYRRNVASLEQLMRSEAGMLMDIVSVSSEASIRALEEVEFLNAERLLDNASYIEQMTRTVNPSIPLLREIAATNGLHRIAFLNREGQVSLEVQTGEEDSEEYPAGYGRVIQSVLAGEKAAGVIGFMEGNYYHGKRYGVVVGRSGGGAIVVDADPDRMLEFRRTVGLGTILREIGIREGIRYIVLQDTLGIVAASSGIREMTRIADDPFLLDSWRGKPDSRTAGSGKDRVLEVVRPLVVDEVHLGLLRVGLSTSAADAIQGRALRQFLVLLIAAALSGAFLVVYVVLRQNYLLLDAEHDRILRDVRLMEEEQRRSERLTSMGRLAAGVAHEIRNPLNAISIIVQRLKAEFTPGEGREEYVTLLTTVRTEIARMGSIIEAFLRYARPPKLEFSQAPIEEIISGAMQVIAEKARQHRVAFEVEITPGLLCRCDPNQFKQALLNILLNAVEAIGEDGAILIRAHREDRDVTIQIADTGPGIPEEMLPKIFDPYFTTKDSGTGLGLSEVHRIVTAHGGRINAENAPSGGAMFTLIMPD
ncbi:MAG: sensor histidine kinase [Candidatus Latescibacterota bacterium]